MLSNSVNQKPKKHESIEYIKTVMNVRISKNTIKNCNMIKKIELCRTLDYIFSSKICNLIL